MLRLSAKNNVERVGASAQGTPQQAVEYDRAGPRFADAAIAFVLGAAILLIRKPDSIFNAQFWAEDGDIFYYQSAAEGAHSILITYAGYYHFIPRILSIIYLKTSSIYFLPLLFNISALIIGSLSCAWLAISRINIKRKWIFAIIPLLMPHGGEVFTNFTDIQWVVAPMLAIISIQNPPSNRTEIASDCFLATIIGMTGPFILMLFPIFLLRFVLSKKKKMELPLFLVITAVTVVQARALYFDSALKVDTVTTWGELPVWFASHGLGPLFGLLLFRHNPAYAATFGLGVACLAAGACLMGLSLFWRLRICAMLAFALIVLSAAARKYGDVTLPIIDPFEPGQRYFYIPYAMIGWSLFILATEARRYWNIVGIGALILCLTSSASSIHHFVAPPMEDLHWREHVEAIQDEADVPINPEGRTVHVFKNR
jgi:hypothetical protein